MSIAYGQSFAALILAPPLNTWLAYGIAATFVASAIGAAFVALRSSLPFAIAAPDGATSAVTATLAATVAERLIAMGPPDDLLAPVMIVVALSTALTGVLLFALGLARAGAAIRFIPYPVIGGYLSATGWLMVSGAVRVITDHGLSLATFGQLLTATTLAQLAAASGVALALYLVLRRARSPLLVPGVLLIATVFAHLAFALTGTILGETLQLGWTFKAPTAVGLAPTWDFSDVRNFPWRPPVGTQRRHLRRHVRDRDHHAAQHHGYRAGHKARGRSRARAKDAWCREFRGRCPRRLCELRLAQPHHADLLGRRAQPHLRLGRRRGLEPDAAGRPSLPRLRPQIRARRPPALSRREPDG